MNKKIFNFLFLRGWKTSRLCRQARIDSLIQVTYTQQGIKDYWKLMKEEFLTKFVHQIISKGYLSPRDLKAYYFPELMNYDAEGYRVVLSIDKRYGWRKYLPLPASIRVRQYDELQRFTLEYRKVIGC